MRAFGERLQQRALTVGSAACVGLDPFPDRLPPSARGGRSLVAAVEAFGEGVIEAVAPSVAVLKPQVAFFEALGSPGLAVLERLVKRAQEAGLLVLADAKRGDIGSTAQAYAHAWLDDDGPVGADALTVSPYLGPESLTPFLQRAAAGKGLFVLLRTSNPGSAVWQQAAPAVAEWIAQANLPYGDGAPVGAVVGATLGAEAGRWRSALGEAWILAPGWGAQGGSAESVQALRRAGGGGVCLVSAREVLYPAQGWDGSDWKLQIAERARQLALVERRLTA